MGIGVRVGDNAGPRDGRTAQLGGDAAPEVFTSDDPKGARPGVRGRCSAGGQGGGEDSAHDQRLDNPSHLILSIIAHLCGVGRAITPERAASQYGHFTFGTEPPYGGNERSDFSEKEVQGVPRWRRTTYRSRVCCPCARL